MNVADEPRKRDADGRVLCVQCDRSHATVNVEWIGGVHWRGDFCQSCCDEFWSKNKGAISMQVGDAVFREVEQ